MIKLILVAIFFVFDVTAVASTPQNHLEGNWEAMSKILKSNMLPPNWQDRDGNSIVYYHLKYGSEITAIDYIKRAQRAKVRIKDTDSLLHFAIQNGMQQVVQALLDAGVSPNARSNEVSPLMLASSNGQLAIMRMLLKAGADINYRMTVKYSHNGSYRVSKNDALISAVRHGKYHAVRVLVDSGLNLQKYIDKKDNDDLLFETLLGGSDDALFFLGRYRLDWNSKNDDGETLLTFAVSKQINRRMIEQLLLRNADPCLTNNSGETPFQIVRKINAKLGQFEQLYEELFMGKCTSDSAVDNQFKNQNKAKTESEGKRDHI